MSTYTVSIAIATNDDCESIAEAVDYFNQAIQLSGIVATVTNDDTGESFEEALR